MAKAPCEKVFAAVKARGFDGVEMMLEEEGTVTPRTSDGELIRLRRCAEDAGLKPYSLMTGLYWRGSFSHNDPAVRRKAIELARRQLEMAKLLGCDTILVVPALVDRDTPYDVAYDRALQALAVLAPYAGECGVSIGVENVWNGFLLSPLEFCRLIDTVNSPYVGAYFDVGNVVYDGYPEQWIRILGSRLRKIHLKDYKRSVRTLQGFVPLGEGDVDFDAVASALRHVGYQDFCTAEYGAAGDGSESTADRVAAFYKTFGSSN